MSKVQILIGGELLTESESNAVQEAVREKLVELDRYIYLQHPDGSWVTEQLSPTTVQTYLDLAKQLRRINPEFPFKPGITWDAEGNVQLSFDPFSNDRVKLKSW